MSYTVYGVFTCGPDSSDFGRENQYFGEEDSFSEAEELARQAKDECGGAFIKDQDGEFFPCPSD